MQITFAQNSTLSKGMAAPDFTSLTLKGNPFTLSSLKGKIVLLDFWASWCAPCIEEQPELLKMYAQYKPQVDEGIFEIVGFSLDNKKESWEKVVNRFQIPWPQVSDLKFWRSPIVKDYGISELPFNLILDPEGNVIATNLHGEELQKFFENLFRSKSEFVSPTD